MDPKNPGRNGIRWPKLFGVSFPMMEISMPFCPLLRDNTILECSSSSENNRVRPDYNDVEERVASFKAWPTKKRPDPRCMADCGLYYIGCGDMVRCVSCLSVLREWKAGDSPFLRHLQLAPTCPFVLDVQRLIDLTIARISGSLPQVLPPWREAPPLPSMSMTPRDRKQGDGRGAAVGASSRRPDL